MVDGQNIISKMIQTLSALYMPDNFCGLWNEAADAVPLNFS